MLKVNNVQYSMNSWHLDVSSSFANGEWTSVIGPSGSGKSTLMNLIMGFAKPHSGQIELDGIDLLPLSPAKRDLAIVFQNDTLFEHLTVFENLQLALHAHKLSKPEMVKKVNEMLERMFLEQQIAKQRPHEISGGQRARVNVARSLLRGSKWLLLDESFSALDEKLRFDLQVWLESLQKNEGLSIISVTHHQQEATMFSHRILAMAEGKVVWQGPASELDAGLQQSPYAETFLSRHSQIERQGRLIRLPSDGIRLEKPPEGSEWKEMLLVEPICIPQPGGTLLRERGSRTVLFFSERLHSACTKVWYQPQKAKILQQESDHRSIFAENTKSK